MPRIIKPNFKNPTLNFHFWSPCVNSSRSSPTPTGIWEVFRTTKEKTRNGHVFQNKFRVFVYRQRVFVYRRTGAAGILMVNAWIPRAIEFWNLRQEIFKFDAIYNPQRVLRCTELNIKTRKFAWSVSGGNKLPRTGRSGSDWWVIRSAGRSLCSCPHNGWSPARSCACYSLAMLPMWHQIARSIHV